MKTQSKFFCCLVVLSVMFVLYAFISEQKDCYAKNYYAEYEIGDKLDNYLVKELQTANVKGMAVEIVSSDKVLYSSIYGDVKETSDNFFVGSMSKSFTALAVVDLAKQGKVDLDLNVYEYLKDYPELKEIKVRDLLNQTSGITSEQILKELSITSNKGSFKYSNANYNLLGKIIEKVTGKSYSNYIKEKIFSPLKMSNTFADYGKKQQKSMVRGYTNYFGFMLPRSVKYPDNDSWSQVPAGYIISNADDMGKYLQMYLKNGDELFDRKTVETVLHNGVDASSDESVISDMYGGSAKYCMGWIEKKVDNESIIYHTGKVENFTSVMVLLPDRNLAMVMLFNSMDFLSGQGLIEQIEENVVSIIRNKDVKEIKAYTYLFQHIIIDMVFILVMFLCALPIVVFLKRERKAARKGRMITFSLIHIVCPIILLSIFPLMKMPLFIVRGFAPDIFIVLMISVILLISGGVMKVVVTVEK